MLARFLLRFDLDPMRGIGRRNSGAGERHDDELAAI
jgi:hypothetical protein